MLDTSLYIDRFVEICKDELKHNLIGVYLHGSLAMNCFNPNGSDIDLLVVVNDQLSREQSRNLVEKVMVLHDDMPYERGIECSIILRSHLNPFKYPTPFELHYSDYHRDRYKKDKNYLCGGFEDEDLAAHFMVAYTRGKCLFGKPLIEVCEPIREQYYLQSILNDVKNAEENVTDDPVYVILNLCRVLYYLEEGFVSSKREGGEWGARTLPMKYRALIFSCLDKYNGTMAFSVCNHNEALLFVKYAGDEIKRRIEKAIP